MSYPCPYPDCERGEVAAAKPPAFCGSCRRPVKFCTVPGCGFANRTLSRYCRNCQAKLPAASSGGAFAALPQTGNDARLVELDENVCHTPIVYADNLWFVSNQGVLYQLSPAASLPSTVKALAGRFGGGRPILTRDAKLKSAPDAIALYSDTAVRLVHLDSKTEDVPFTCPDGVRLLADQEEAFTTLAQDQENYYAVGRQKGQAVIVQIPRDGTRESVHLLPQAQVVSGPVVIGQAVLAFSRDHVYWLRHGKVGYKLWDGEFATCVGRKDADASEVRPAFGQTGFMSTRFGTYVYGALHGRPAFALITGFDAEPNMTFCPMDAGSALFAQVGDGPPVVARRDEIVTFDGTQQVTLRHDEELVPESAPYYDGRDGAGFIHGVAGGKFLRLFRGNTLADFPLADREDYEQGTAFLPCAGRLVHMYCGREKARFLIW